MVHTLSIKKLSTLALVLDFCKWKFWPSGVNLLPIMLSHILFQDDTETPKTWHH